MDLHLHAPPCHTPLNDDIAVSAHHLTGVMVSNGSAVKLAFVSAFKRMASAVHGVLRDAAMLLTVRGLGD